MIWPLYEEGKPSPVPVLHCGKVRWDKPIMEWDSGGRRCGVAFKGMAFSALKVKVGSQWTLLTKRLQTGRKSEWR